MNALIVGISGIVIGWGLSFISGYFLNLQNHKRDVIKQNFEHNHNLIKQKSEHSYERRIFLRQKYEELSFRIIDFTNILKALSTRLYQTENENNLNTDEFAAKGAKIEIITVLYFPELTVDCKDFLAVSYQLLLAHDLSRTQDVDNFELSKVEFNESFDKLYDQIKKHISDYT